MLCDGRIDAHSLLCLAKSFELYNSIDQREKSIVASDPNVVSRMKFRSTLSHQNASCRDKLAAESLDAEALGIAIPAVS